MIKGGSKVLSGADVKQGIQGKATRRNAVPPKETEVLQSHMLDTLESNTSSGDSVIWPTLSVVDTRHLNVSSERLAEIQEEDDGPGPDDDLAKQTPTSDDVNSSGQRASSARNFLQIPTGVRITNSGKVFRDQQEVGLDHLTKDVVAHLQLNNQEESGEDFVSPFFDGNESSNTLLSLPSDIKEQKQLTITDSGKVFRGKQEVGLDHLTKDVVAHLQLNKHEESSEDFVSPFFEGSSSRVSSVLISSAPTRSEIQPSAGPKTMGTGGVRSSAWHQGQRFGNTRQHSLLLSPRLSAKSDGNTSDLARMLSIPVEFDRKEARKHGLNLIRQMSQARSHEIAAEDQNVLRLQTKHMNSVIMGKRATETLGSRLFSQPGSVMLSTIFSQLSQMLPSQLEQKGLVIPIIPDNIFEHSIAAQPNFEFRELPSKTIMFFSINILMITCVCAGGILAIFYAN